MRLGKFKTEFSILVVEDKEEGRQVLEGRQVVENEMEEDWHIYYLSVIWDDKEDTRVRLTFRWVRRRTLEDIHKILELLGVKWNRVMVDECDLRDERSYYFYKDGWWVATFVEPLRG